jgi:ElaB/YqjD/DUF883 family membrane-anchored ribosome-binding protein
MQARTEYLTELKLTLDNYTEQLATIKNEFQDASENDVDTLTKSLKSLLSKAQDAYKKLAAASEDDWDEVRKITAKVFTDLQKAFSEVFDSKTKQIMQMSHQAAENVEGYVKEHPLKSILMSLGLGVLIGKLFR